MKKTALLHGGGLDSTALFLDLVHQGIEFDCVSFSYGQEASSAEYRAIRDQCTKYKVAKHVHRGIDSIRKANQDHTQNCMLFTGDHSHSPIVEYRNFLLINEAVLMGYDTIYIGLDKPASGKAWGDASVEFLELVNRLMQLSFNTRKIEVLAPYINMDKAKVYRNAMKLDPKFFVMSMTCWTPTDDNLPCGLCKHCVLERDYRKLVK